MPSLAIANVTVTHRGYLCRVRGRLDGVTLTGEHDSNIRHNSIGKSKGPRSFKTLRLSVPGKLTAPIVRSVTHRQHQTLHHLMPAHF